MTTWQEIKKDLKNLFNMFLLYGVVGGGLLMLWNGVISPNEREGTVETAGCRTTIIEKKRPILDTRMYTCVYERKNPKDPETITGRFCARVETESGICTLAEIYSVAAPASSVVPTSSVETPTVRPETCHDPHERLGTSGLCFCEPGYHSDPTTLKCITDQ